MADVQPEWKEFFHADYTIKNRLVDFMEKKEMAESVLKKAFEDGGFTEMHEICYSLDWIPTKQAFFHCFTTSMR